MKFKRRIEEDILLLKIRQGDQAAFAAVYDRYVDQLYRFVAFRVRQVELAQDLTSELFLKVWQRLSQSERQVQNLQAYLYQMARNLIADHYRSRQAELPLDEAVDVSAEARGQQPSVEVRLALTDVERGLQRLKPEWQEVVILAHVEGLKPREIAVIIGKSPAATRVMLHRALQELQRLLGS